ncbi:hypothetical protein BH24DEI2_BH24DEI2_08770 [soil metagenome]
MTYVVVLVALLIALAGVIAYTGDVLGTLVGKRRLSLFGARPKQSGRIIGVLAGILIMLVTLATLALSFRNAVKVIMSAQPVAAQLAEQEVRLERSTAQVASLQEQVAARNQELAQAQEEVATAESARDEARADVTALKETQAELQGSVDTLTNSVNDLDASLATAKADVSEAEANLTAARQQLTEAEKAREQAVGEAADAGEVAAASRQEVKSLTEEVEAARAQLDTIQAELGASRQDLETAQTNLADTQTQLTDTKNALASVKIDLEQANDARDEALQAQAAAEQVRDEAETRAATLQAGIDDLKKQADELTSQNDDLSARNSGLVQTNRELANLKAGLETRAKDLGQQLENLTATNETLKQSLEEQTSELDRVKQEAANVNSKNISYDINQVVHSGVVKAQEPTLIRAQLAQLVAVAREKVVLRGGLDVTLTPEQTENIVQEAAQTPGEDIVVLRSRMNQYVSAPVEVAVEVAPNQKLLADAQLVVSRQIFLGTGSRDNVRDDLLKVLADANAKLLGLGLSDEVYPSLSDTSLEVEGFTNQLLRLKGPVTVGLQASAPIFAGGPAKLEFVIVN